MKLYRLLAVPAAAGIMFGVAGLAGTGAVFADERTQVQRAICINGECTTHSTDETLANAGAAVEAQGRNLKAQAQNWRQNWLQARLKAREARMKEQLGRLQTLSAKGGEKGAAYSGKNGYNGGENGDSGFNLNIRVGNQTVEQGCNPKVKQNNRFEFAPEQVNKNKRLAKWLEEVENSNALAAAINVNQSNQQQTSCQTNANSQVAFGILALIDQDQASSQANVVTASQDSTQSNDNASAAASTD